MAAVTTMKCSARRTALRQIQALVNELIALNESADRLRVQLLVAGQSAAEVSTSVNFVLTAAGPGTTATTAATGDKIVDRLINMLNANATDTSGQVGWEYLAE